MHRRKAEPDGADEWDPGCGRAGGGGCAGGVAGWTTP